MVPMANMVEEAEAAPGAAARRSSREPPLEVAVARVLLEDAVVAEEAAVGMAAAPSGCS
jgi:hypothetical protein